MGNYLPVGAGTNMNFEYFISTLIANETKEQLHIVVTDSQDKIAHRTLEPQHGFKARCRNWGNFTARAYRKGGDGKWIEYPVEICSDIAGHYVVFKLKDQKQPNGDITCSTGR